MEKQSLIAAFEPFGTILETTLIASKGFAFVLYDKTSSVDNCMRFHAKSQIKIDKRPVVVRRAMDKKYNATATLYSDTTKLLVRKNYESEKRLREYFSTLGDVVKIDMNRPY